MTKTKSPSCEGETSRLVEEVLKNHMRWHLKVIDAVDDVIVIDSWSATKEDCKRVLELEYGDEIPDHIEVSIEKQPLYTKQAIREAIEAGSKSRDEEVELLKKRIWRLEGYHKQDEMSLKEKLVNQEETIGELLE